MKTDKAFAALEDFVKKSPDTECAPEVKKQFADKLKETKEKLKAPPLETDKWIYRSVVGFLGLAILSCLFFTFYLSVGHTGSDIKVPEMFLAIGSAAVGALAGLLAPSPGRGSNESP